VKPVKTSCCSFLLHFIAALSVVLLWSSPLQARPELTIEITRGNDRAVPIAVIPFEWQGLGVLPEDVAGIITNDLRLSGEFAPLPGSQFLGYPARAGEVYFSDWRRLGVSWLVVGRIEPGTRGYKILYELVDVQSGRSVLRREVEEAQGRLRSLAHGISDAIYGKIRGVRGAFSTRIAYVQAERRHGKGSRFQLMYADMDGHGAAPLLKSPEPILAPSWSPDGSRLAYVSFETGHPVVYVHRLASGRREAVSAFPGINNAPRWSPDGRQLAVALSKGGNSDIYVLNLKTAGLTQVTRHYAIDSEPTWTPDSKHLVFSSNRGGSVQLYDVTLASGVVKRLSFTGTFNARAQVFPDARNIVFVHRGKGQNSFNIAMQNLESGRLRILSSDTSMDDAPGVAPNGRMVIYSARDADGRFALDIASVNGRSRHSLPIKVEGADVYEPAWSPFLTSTP